MYSTFVDQTWTKIIVLLCGCSFLCKVALNKTQLFEEEAWAQPPNEQKQQNWLWCYVVIETHRKLFNQLSACSLALALVVSH
jgi:hypothetical protein